MVRARDREAVDRAQPVHDELREMLASAQAEGCYLYAFDERDRSKAYARFFNPTVGLWDDPATGTAAGPLTAYLGAKWTAWRRSTPHGRARDEVGPSELSVR